MTVQDYDAMQESKHTPKVWVVDVGSSFNGMIHSKLFLDKQKAEAFAYWAAHKNLPHVPYCEIYRTWDIWNFTAKHTQEV